MFFRKFAILIFLPLAVGGCMRGEDGVVLPAGHPAEPGARPGVMLGGSTALEPELMTVRAAVEEPAGRPAAPEPAGQHRPHQH